MLIPLDVGLTFTQADIALWAVAFALGAIGGLGHALVDRAVWDSTVEYELARRAVIGGLAALALVASGHGGSAFAAIGVGYIGTDIVQGLLGKMTTADLVAAAIAPKTP